MAVFPAVFGLLMAALVTGQNVDITPREAVVRAGGDLKVLCKVPYKIDSCRMTVGSLSHIVRPGQETGDVIYYGQGLETGECGAFLRDIKESWNGNITCVLPPETGSIENTATMKLIVAKAPVGVQLISPPQAAFKEGDTFMAQCVVPDGRPAAKISWLFNDEELLTGIHKAIVTSEPGSDLQTISQNISKVISADDGGKTITCLVEHEALPEPRIAKRQLVVHYAPKVDSSTITIFGLQLNAEGRLNVTVRAQPPPIVEWQVGSQKLRAPALSDDGLVSALEPLHLENGFYNVTLIINQIKKEDVDRTYYLHLSNVVGYNDVAVRISTMEEPEGVELETGAIVGIVIAVLVLLIAVSLVVFAFATDRWCFAGCRARR